MKKERTVVLTIDGYGSAGEGVGRLDGQAVFVKGALRGETCRVRLDKVGKRAAWGTVVEVLTPSPHRAAPDCPQFPTCGGCALRHMDYAEELRYKRGRVEDALRRIGGWTGTVETIHGAAQPDRYRNKIQFPVAEGPRIGFYRARSHLVIDAPDCRLQPEQATRLRAAFRDWMVRYAVPAYDERAHAGLIRHLYVRVDRAGRSLCAVVANGDRLPHTAELIDLLRAAEPELVGLVLSVHTARTNVILGTRYETLWGRDHLEDTLCGLSFRLSVPSFYQVNRAQTEVLYGRALALAGLTGTETALDLYCGIGTITLCLARGARRALGAEVVPEAVADARRNAVRNGVANAEFFCADAGQAALRLAAEGVRPDVITVDPPRKGLSPEVIEAVAQMAPQRLVYVSCDPGTLARDVALLRERGYELRTAEAVDLFPRTHHVETVCLLVRRNGLHIDIDVDVEEMLQEKRGQATYAQIKNYAQDLIASEERKTVVQE